MTTVAALGFGDIPPAAFVGAFNLIETPGLLAFTIKDDFLGDDDPSGFSGLIQRSCRWRRTTTGSTDRPPPRSEVHTALFTEGQRRTWAASAIVLSRRP